MTLTSTTVANIQMRLSWCEHGFTKSMYGFEQKANKHTNKTCVYLLERNSNASSLKTLLIKPVCIRLPSGKKMGGFWDNMQ